MGLFNKNKSEPVEAPVDTLPDNTLPDSSWNFDTLAAAAVDSYLDRYHGSPAHLEQLEEARASNDHQLTVERAQSQSAFLVELRQTGNVSRACAAAGISRTIAYNWKANDEGAGDDGDGDGFSAKWNEVHNAYIDGLEQEVDRRAFVGYDQPVVYQGELMRDAKTGELVTVKKFSDSLVALRLRALRRDKYSERNETHHTGGTDNTNTQRVIFTMPDNGRDS